MTEIFDEDSTTDLPDVYASNNLNESDPAISKTDLDNLKLQVLIGFCCLCGVVIILVFGVFLLLWKFNKLQKMVRALDPMKKYKKISKSTYLKKQDPPLPSSSFNMFPTHYEADNMQIIPPLPKAKLKSVKNKNNKDQKKTSEIGTGTLDRNFFTTSDFQYQNPLSRLDGYLDDESEEKIKSQSSFDRRDHLSQINKEKLFY